MCSAELCSLCLDFSLTIVFSHLVNVFESLGSNTKICFFYPVVVSSRQGFSVLQS